MILQKTTDTKNNQNSTNPIRIVFIVHGTPAYGGLEIYLLRFISNLGKELFQPYVLIPGYTDLHRSSPPEFIDKVQEMNIPLLQPRNPGDIRGYSVVRDILHIRKLLRDVNADIVHIHTVRPEGERRPMIGAQAAGVPVIIRTEHCSPILFGNPSGNHFVTRILDGWTNKIVTVSEHNRHEQIEFFGRPPEKLHRSYTGVELEMFDPDHDIALAKEQLGLSPEIPVIGAVGRLDEVKGYSYLVDAAPEILEAFGPVNFLLVGEGPLEDTLKKQISSLDLQDYFHLAGYQENPVPYLEAMDITVMPSLSEGLGLSLIEYMAMGKPSVITDCPAMVEVVADESNCIIVPIQDAKALCDGILRLLRNPAEARKKGRLARKRVETSFDFQTHVDDMMNLYVTSLNGHH